MPEQRLSDSYHRARRMFALLCGILIAWEYIGINIGGGGVNNNQSVTGIAPGLGLPVTFRNPEVIPTIILILVLYFSFRFTIEWRQSPIEIRNHITSIIDAAMAYLIGLLAVILFLLQRITPYRLAEVFIPKNTIVTITAVFFVHFLINIAMTNLPRRWRHPIFFIPISLALSVFLAFIAFDLFNSRPDLLQASLIGFFIGILPHSIISIVMHFSDKNNSDLFI